MDAIHDRIDELIAASAAGGLSDEERRLLADHVATCGECRAKFEEAKRVADLASGAFASEKPSEGFEDRAVDAFHARANKDAALVAPAAPRARSAWGTLPWGIAAAAVLVTVVVLAGSFRGDGKEAEYKTARARQTRDMATESSVLKTGEAGLALSSPTKPGTADGRIRVDAAIAAQGDRGEAFDRIRAVEELKDAGKALERVRKEQVGLVGVVVSDHNEAEESEPDDGRGPGRYGPSLESYDHVEDNPFRKVGDDPMSTFSIDVDTASYSNVRRHIMGGSLPPRAAVRIEELINYFSYSYPEPSGSEPFSVTTGVARCPWNLQNRIVRIGIKGRTIRSDSRPPSNLVFLVDVSGSMQDSNKLPLVQQGLRMLTAQLTEDDHVAIVTYAGATRVALPSTPASNKSAILAVIDSLGAGGSTAGAAGLVLAYGQASASFLPKGVNRVILCTDGDFNVGITDRGELVKMIEEKAKLGVALTVLGFGMGNLKDDTMEQLADKGNGNYAYIDTEREARKVLVDQMSGTLVTIAKDVKIQVEFNPVKVGAWRLIGYENRVLRHEDFNDDTKDAGEIGAGHTVTALYEIVPATQAPQRSTDPLRYQSASQISNAAYSNEVLALKLRYKEPDGDTSLLIETPVLDSTMAFDQASQDFRFAASVAAFGMLLRESPHKGSANYAMVRELAGDAVASDPSGLRAEFLDLAARAETLKR